MKIPKTDILSPAYRDGWTIPFSFLQEVKKEMKTWMDLDEETIEMVLLASEKVLRDK